MDTRVDQLEYTVMELGTEVFRLKSEISNMTQIQKQMVKALQKFKAVIDDQGMISLEDFEKINLELSDPSQEEEGLEDILPKDFFKPDYH